MKRYTMFLDWKNQHCENDCTTQSKLQIQCNPYQTTNGIFHRTGTKNFTICMETQKTPNSQSNLEKEKRSWRNQAPGLQRSEEHTSELQSLRHLVCRLLLEKKNWKFSLQFCQKMQELPYIGIWHIVHGQNEGSLNRNSAHIRLLAKM